MRAFKRKILCAVCNRPGKAIFNYSGHASFFDKSKIIPDRLGMLSLPKGWDNFRQVSKGIVLLAFVCRACKAKQNKIVKG